MATPGLEIGVWDLRFWVQGLGFRVTNAWKPMEKRSGNEVRVLFCGLLVKSRVS